MIKIIHILGENAIDAADLMIPFGSWSEDTAYSFKIKTKYHSIESLDRINKKIDLMVICSDRKNTGSILCLKRSLEKQNIKYKMIHLQQTETV